MADYFNALISDLSEKPLKANEPKSNALNGKSIAIKNNIHIKGYTVSCASHILKNYKSIYNATVIDHILNAGGEINACVISPSNNLAVASVVSEFRFPLLIP